VKGNEEDGGRKRWLDKGSQKRIPRGIDNNQQSMK
jgi:hypothetical protein